MKTFAIDYIREILSSTLAIEHHNNPNLVGGINQVAILSFYEQLLKREEVDRFVENYQALVGQENRQDLIAVGAVVANDNPTYTNINQSTIIPLGFSLSLRTTLENRDDLMISLNNLIAILKGRKVDIAELDNGKLFMVGTIANNSIGAPLIKSGDFIGDITLLSQISNKLKTLSLNGIVNNKKTNIIFPDTVNWVGSLQANTYTANINFKSNNTNYTSISFIQTTNGSSFVNSIKYDNTTVYYYGIGWTDDNYKTILVDDLSVYNDLGKTLTNAFKQTNIIIGSNNSYLYYKDTTDNKLKVAYFDGTEWKTITADDGTYEDIVFPYEHNSFKKYSVSMSFNALNCIEPYDLNGKKYCDIQISGNATICNSSVMLGNGLTKVGIRRYRVLPDSALNTSYEWLEPMELPSANNPTNLSNLLSSNKFINNTHNESVSLTLNYTFILDRNIPLLDLLFKYARYGTQNTSTGISPNMIYLVKELWSCWGDVEFNEIRTRITGSIDIENTESDVLTITIPMQIQGDND